MGNHCSVKLAPVFANPESCGVISGLHLEEPACAMCGENLQTAALQGPHPMLLEELQPDGFTATPRGPTPPWAKNSTSTPVDRTATGATPPRSPTPPRAAPLGLPEDSGDPLGPAALAAGLDSVFIQDLFRIARCGDSNTLDGMLRSIHGHAQALVSKTLGPIPIGSQASSERRDKASEMVAAFLSQLRSPIGGSCRDTLLGTAASNGHLELVRVLLAARADPAVCDDQGCNTLHRAAESGNQMVVFLVLDRLQAIARSLSIAELTNVDGETPEMFAALAGASEVCRAFEIFSDMQNDAEERQLGCSAATTDFAVGHRGNSAGSLLAYLDLNPNAESTLQAATILRRSMFGNGLVTDIFGRLPEDQSQIAVVVERVCRGLFRAEEILLSRPWILPDRSDASLDPSVRAFARTADVRARWQQSRNDAVSEENESEDLDEFWHTHLSADVMSGTLRNAYAGGRDVFQLLLTVMWLYTREGWLRHILDTLACTPATSFPVSGGSVVEDGATGATPSAEFACHRTSNSLESLASLEDLKNALTPYMEMVQLSLNWFEETGVRHTAVTYRPLSLPMLGLQRVIDRYIAVRQLKEKDTNENDGNMDVSLDSDAWVTLGSGTFFSTLSSKREAIRRLSRTRCNVLLSIRPDDDQPVYPKQMSLRGSGIDDVIFPLGTLYRITRITRIVSSDLDPESCRGGNVRWPVIVFELAAASRFLEVAEKLDLFTDAGSGDLDRYVKAWTRAAQPTDRTSRLINASALLMKRCGLRTSSQMDTSRNLSKSSNSASSQRSQRIDQALEWLREASNLAQAAGDTESRAQALLLIATCMKDQGSNVAKDREAALKLLEAAHGNDHPATCAARAAWANLVNDPSHR